MAQTLEDELEPLITECPSCRTQFRVAETQLRRAAGRVRCGACLTVFHGVQQLVLDGVPGELDPNHAHPALDALLDELSGRDAAGEARWGASVPAAPLPETPPRAPAFHLPGGRADAPAAAADPACEDGSRPTTGCGPEPEAEPATAAAPEAAPVQFGEPRVRRPGVWFAIVLGLLLLAGQVLWYRFDDWAQLPAWRSVYAPVCGVLGCELPVRRDASLLETRNLVVRVHPREPEALLINAVIVNRAEFAQPFPVLELQFTSVRGAPVAAPRVAPETYLAGDAEGMTLMPPRTPVQVELTLPDPGPDAVNYRLNFR